MNELEPVGKIENPETLDFRPIVIPVYGYTEDGEERVFKLQFRAVQPFGRALEVMRTMDNKGNVDTTAAMKFLDDCIHSTCKQSWQDWLNDPEIYIQQSTLILLYQSLMQEYASRPTLQRLAPSDLLSPMNEISLVAASETESTSTHSASEMV